MCLFWNLPETNCGIEMKGLNKFEIAAMTATLDVSTTQLCVCA